MPRYQSDVTVFLEKLKAAKPNLEQDQRAGRALLWDKEPISLDEQRRLNTAKVKQRAYVYSNE